MDVDAESSLRKPQIIMPMIKCLWCKRKKPCEEFDNYVKKKGYYERCKDCRQLDCSFCGCSFKSKSKAPDPPHYAACEAKECRRKKKCKPRNCSNASCIYHRKKINPWILNDKGKTIFKLTPNRKFLMHCRSCSECISRPGGYFNFELRENDTLVTSSSTSMQQRSSISVDSMPMIICKWCKKEKHCGNFEQLRKTLCYRTVCNHCRKRDCSFCGCSFHIIHSKGSDPPRYPACEAKQCKRRSAVKPRQCTNASCIYHRIKINPWILNDEGETTFKPRKDSHFSAKCRKCQQQ